MSRSILFKVWRFPLLSETFIVNQVITAIRLGYDVQILVEETMDIAENSSPQLFMEYSIEEKIIKEDYRIPQNRIARFLKAGFLMITNPFMIRMLREFYGASNRRGLFPVYQLFFYKQFRNHDVVHVQFGTNKYPLDVLKQIGFLKSRLVASFHGHDLYFPINNRIPNNGYYDVLFRFADALISNTPFLKEKLVELAAPEEKIRVIPVAVDTNMFTPVFGMRSSNKFKLITVGRLEKFKGQSWGIKTIEKLVEKGFAVEYTIVGTGSLLESLQSQVQDLGLTDTIFFTGALSQLQVRKLLQVSDVFLMTSITDPDYGVESQGLVTAEAQACGLPVVAFNTGGVKYTLIDGETGFLCQEKNVEALAEKVELFVKYPDLRKKMGDKAVEFIQREYSENSIRRKWSEIYG